MMKTNLIGLFAAVAVAALAGCGGGGSDSSLPAPAPAPVGVPLPPPAPASAPAPTPAPPAPSPAPAPAAPIASATPTSLTFPLTAVGVTSAPMVETISNVGTANLVLTSIANTVGPFRVTGGSCFTAGPIPPSGSCTVLVTFTPTTHGPSPAANLTFVANSLPDTVVLLAGTSPATVTVIVGSKTYALAYPPAIANLPDTDPGALITDSTASLWSLVSGVRALGSTTTPLPTPQLIASIPWPIKFALWSKNIGGGGGFNVTGNQCQIDLVGPNLVVTVNGESISVAVDGTPTVLAPNGQVAYPGDVLVEAASQRTIGVQSVVRRAEINAFDGSLQGQWTQLALGATYDSHKDFGASGIQGSLLVTVATPTSSNQYRCADDAGQ